VQQSRFAISRAIVVFPLAGSPVTITPIFINGPVTFELRISSHLPVATWLRDQGQKMRPYLETDLST
jgi:hypothetical protein